MLKYNLANRLKLNRDFSKDINITFQKRSNSVFKRKFSKDFPPILPDNKSEFNNRSGKPNFFNNLRISSLGPFSNINIIKKNEQDNKFKHSLTSLISNKNTAIPFIDPLNSNKDNSSRHKINENFTSLPSLMEKSTTSFHPEINKNIFEINCIKNNNIPEVCEDFDCEEKNYLILENLKGKIIPNTNVNVPVSMENNKNSKFSRIDFPRYPNENTELRTTLDNINGKNFKCFSSLKGRIILNKNLS